MTDQHGLHEQVEGLEHLMDSLRFHDDPIEAPPPATDPVMVVRSLRLPLDLDAQLKAAARSHGVAVSTLVRQWIEQELTALQDDQPISRADALRALATLRPLGRTA